VHDKKYNKILQFCNFMKKKKQLRGHCWLCNRATPVNIYVYPAYIRLEKGPQGLGRLPHVLHTLTSVEEIKKKIGNPAAHLREKPALLPGTYTH
jgi:hypothetical protein